MPRYDHPQQSCNIAHWSIFDLTPSAWLSPRWVMAYLPETLLYLCLPRDWDKSVGSAGRMKLGLGAVSFFYARPAQASLLLVHVLVVLWLAASYKCNRHLEIVMFFMQKKWTFMRLTPLSTRRRTGTSLAFSRDRKFNHTAPVGNNCI